MKKINFLIKAGKHYANNFFRHRLIFSRSIEFEFKLSYSAYYDYKNVINGWSKVLGLSEGNHHRNSMRLAFINNSAGLQAGAYCYSKGKRQMITLPKIATGLWYKVKITRDYSCWIIEFTDHYSQLTEIHTVTAPERKRIPFLFVLHPYVGGRFTLNQDLKIDVQLK
jgi:hypothetical protein